MRLFLSCILAGALLGGAARAQLSGQYAINPTGTGTNVFNTITEAVNTAFISGVGGPVEFLILPGTYTESVLVPPIPGTSATNTVTFTTAAGPGSVRLIGSAGDTFALLGVSFAHNAHLVFDGLVFDNAPGHAISATRFVESIEVRNCEFGGNHRASATGEFRHALIVSDNSGSEAGWKVHHNKFTCPSHTTRSSYGIYLSNGGDWEIHANEFDLNGCDHGLYLINNNRRNDRIYNNLFYGDLRTTTSTSSNSTNAIRADISNYDNDITHNTFLLNVPGTGGSAISTSGTTGTTPAENRIRNNIIVMTGPGTCITVSVSSGQPRPFTSDGNIFWAPMGEIGRLGSSNPGIATLANWQTTTGQDGASLQVDPLFINGTTPPFDLHLQMGSPARDSATLTPAFVTEDFDRRLRDAMPDIGAYELSGFAIYGRGCPGTGGNVPVISASGSVALGSTNFRVDLSGALPASLAILAGGGSRQFSGATPLPFALGGGCFVLAAPDVTNVRGTDPGGTAGVQLNIPNDPALAGVNVFFQWFVVDPQAPSNFGIAASNGGALQL